MDVDSAESDNDENVGKNDNEDSSNDDEPKFGDEDDDGWGSISGSDEQNASDAEESFAFSGMGSVFQITL